MKPGKPVHIDLKKDTIIHTHITNASFNFLIRHLISANHKGRWAPANAIRTIGPVEVFRIRIMLDGLFSRYDDNWDARISRIHAEANRGNAFGGLKPWPNLKKPIKKKSVAEKIPSLFMRRWRSK
jgi:hypothetical protein